MEVGGKYKPSQLERWAGLMGKLRLAVERVETQGRHSRTLLDEARCSIRALTANTDSEALVLGQWAKAMHTVRWG